MWRTRSRRLARGVPDGPLLGCRPAARALRVARRDSLLTVWSCLVCDGRGIDRVAVRQGRPDGAATPQGGLLRRGYRQSAVRAAPGPAPRGSGRRPSGLAQPGPDARAAETSEQEIRERPDEG